MARTVVLLRGRQQRWCTLVVVLVALLVPARAAGVDGTGQPTDEKTVKIQLDPFMELCKGTHELPPAYTRLLTCWYDSRNYYGELAPTKVEMLSINPFIAVLHDVIHDGEIATLQQLGETSIQKSGLTNDSWLPVYYENHQTYTLHDRDHPVVETLSRRIEQLTGLSCDTAEDLKVIYNEMGAFKTADLDVIQTQEEWQRFAYAGNRLATVLFFLSDVERGGYTIFPKARVFIPPKKGAAAIWYSLQDTGEGNERAKYSICPLQSEVKWTAKKIIHTRGNELRHPCMPRPAGAANAAGN